MPNTDKDLREHVQQEPTDEFFGVEGHHALYVSMSVIPPAERDVVAIKGEQSMIGDGNAMRVTAEITQYLFGTAEGRFGIDDPFVPMQLSHERGKAVPPVQVLDLSIKVQALLRIGFFESFHELATKYTLQDLQWQKESVRSLYPVLAARGKSTRWNHAVDVRMKQHVLPPSVQDAEEANFRSKMFRIRCDFDEGVGHGAEQQAAKFGLILQDESI